MTQAVGEVRGRGGASHRREPLTRERVVEAALRVMDAEGLEAVTMRRIGRELGVEAMSLYNHVRDKEDLLDGVTEKVLAGFVPPEPSEDWTVEARAVAHEWRRLLKAHPNVIRLLVEREKPLVSLEALFPMEIAFDILRRAGLSPRDTVNAFRAVGGYIFGHVMMEVGNVAPAPGEAAEGVPEEILRQIPADRFPRLLELLPDLAHCQNDETFGFGLDLLIEGLRARTARTA